MANPLLFLASRMARFLPEPVKRGLYKLGPVTRLIRGTLNKAAPQGLTEVTIAAGILEGLRFKLDMQTEKDYWLGTYEPEFQAALEELVPPGALIYELGANVGYTSLCLGKAVGSEGKVFCFEALPENQERLRENLALNPDLSQFTVVPLAVADKPGEVQFLVHASDDMGKVVGSAGREAKYQDTITIQATSLDDYVYNQGNPPPEVIKMDIEGGEILALPGMKRVLAQAKPLMLVELHGPESAQAAWEALTRNGYSIHRMASGFSLVKDLDALDWKAYLIGKPPA
jgi:FkbM family methyltransferase